MEQVLYDAAVNNNVPTLIQLIRQNPNLLDRTNLSCEDKNPLHIAVVMGNLGFVQAILQFNASYYMCFARDPDGRNPLHLAAMYGRLDVLKVLIDAVFPAALEKADGGGTILHLCVKYNQLDALEFLAGKLKDPNFVNAKNEDGLTILHLAVYYYNKQITKFLLESTEVGVNVKNSSGKTALDLVLSRGEVDSEIVNRLQLAKALKGKNVPSPIDLNTRKREWYEKSREAIMVVAALIATMAFQAGVSPPGGVWADDLLEGPNPHRIGEAVLAQTHPTYYRHLRIANTIAMISSLSTIILLIRGSGIPSKYLIPLLKIVMHLSVTSIAITFGISLGVTASKSERQRLSTAGGIVLVVLLMWIRWVLSTVYEIYAQCKRGSEFKSWMQFWFEQYD